MANGDWDPYQSLRKTNAPGYFVNESGAIVNDDELAWMRYKAEREKTKLIMDLKHQVEVLNRRVQELERRLNGEITTYS
jgi:hypothetical protein